MKIILHMGQAKTGTTSLQESLHAAASSLSRHGVLYPNFGYGFVAHHLLLGLCGSADHLPPWNLDRLGGADGARSAARLAWEKTCDEVRDKRPEVLVLSSEYLLYRPKAFEKAKLRALLSGLSDVIVPVVYVRHPVDLYRSLLQQSLKHRDQPFPPATGRLRPAILEIEAKLGCKPQLVAFDRSVLHQGDIVQDFATRFLAPHVDPSSLPTVNENISLSAEALILLAQLREASGGTYEAARQVSALIPRLEKLDRSDPPARPVTLLPEVAEAALRSASGHRWLVETGQLEIPRLDIEKIDGASPPEWMYTARPETFFFHDPDRLERLRLAVERHVTRDGRPKAPSNEENPRVRDLVLRFLVGKLASLQDRNIGAEPQRTPSARGPTQGERNEDRKTDSKLDTGSGDRP